MKGNNVLPALVIGLIVGAAIGILYGSEDKFNLTSNNHPFPDDIFKKKPVLKDYGIPPDSETY